MYWYLDFWSGLNGISRKWSPNNGIRMAAALAALLIPATDGSVDLGCITLRITFNTLMRKTENEKLNYTRLYFHTDKYYRKFVFATTQNRVAQQICIYRKVLLIRLAANATRSISSFKNLLKRCTFNNGLVCFNKLAFRSTLITFQGVEYIVTYICTYPRKKCSTVSGYLR